MQNKSYLHTKGGNICSIKYFNDRYEIMSLGLHGDVRRHKSIDVY